ncbi:MAG: YqgE/AlgH family protein [Alphaproteobacteria bacterium]|nr:YqgE/AlgH family protein [Alphaproteobacteria bacterium]
MKDLLSKLKGERKPDSEESGTYFLSGKLEGKLLIAAPDMPDPRFAKTVIYICYHTKSTGSIGFIINRLFGDVTLAMLLEQLSIDVNPQFAETPVHFGGPLEMRRGFVLHSDDYLCPGTTKINNHIAVTSTSDIIKDLAHGKGPKNSMLILGYSGWTQGQLEQELKLGGWLTVEPDYNLLFTSPLETRWEQSLTKLGVQPGMLSSVQGTA